MRLTRARGRGGGRARQVQMTVIQIDRRGCRACGAGHGCSRKTADQVNPARMCGHELKDDSMASLIAGSVAELHGRKCGHK